MAVKKATSLTQKAKEVIEHFESTDIDSNRIVAAISYLWILFLIPLFLKRKSKFAQFHARQGLVLFLLEVVGTFLFWIPLLGPLLFLALCVAAIGGFLMALSGKAYPLPVISGIAEKIDF
ncbi:MAG TPA: hypothetical protein VJA22_01890 [Patescibacteria group bacterium]|nr:hypothetical protein [Patescibacteria group bacterium]